MQRMALQVVDIKDCGWPSQVCPLGSHLPGASPCTVPGLWGPGVPPQAVTVALLIHVHTSTCNISSSPSCSGQGGLGLLVRGQFSTGWPERAPLHPHLCQQTRVSVASDICIVGTDRTCQEIRSTEEAGEVSCWEVLAALVVDGDFLRVSHLSIHRKL